MAILLFSLSLLSLTTTLQEEGGRGRESPLWYSVVKQRTVDDKDKKRWQRGCSEVLGKESFKTIPRVTLVESQA